MDKDKNKEKFLSYYWVEDRHKFLKSLPIEDEKQLVDSFSENEIDMNVNYRRFQEQYICDYIDYLWQVSKRSFWKHIAISLKNTEGLIPSESDFTTSIMVTERMPKYVFKPLIKALERLVRKSEDPINDIFCEVHAEIICCKLSDKTEQERLKPIALDWFDNLGNIERTGIHSLFKKNIDEKTLNSLGFGL